MLFGLFLVSIVLSSCEETISKFDSLTVQVAVNSRNEYDDRNAPSSKLSYTDLNNYAAYRDNRDRIIKSDFYQFSYWLDDLRLANGQEFDTLINKDMHFEFVKFYIQFLDVNKQPIQSESPILFATFENPYIKDFYKHPRNILEADDTIAEKINLLIKEYPQFNFIDEFGKVVDETGRVYDTYNFPYLESRFDLVIRFEIEL